MDRIVSNENMHSINICIRCFATENTLKVSVKQYLTVLTVFTI